MANYDYYYAGLSCAWSIIQGGPSPSFLSTVLYEAISSGILPHMHIPFSEVPDTIWPHILMQVYLILDMIP